MSLLEDLPHRSVRHPHDIDAACRSAHPHAVHIIIYGRACILSYRADASDSRGLDISDCYHRKGVGIDGRLSQCRFRGIVARYTALLIAIALVGSKEDTRALLCGTMEL